MMASRLSGLQCGRFVMLVVIAMGARGAAQANGAEPAPPLPQDQKDAIAAETAPEKLVEMAKTYSIQRAFAGANAAIEKAIKLQPALLTDAKVQSPRSWNEYWFTQRAALQEQKLARNDAAGRVKLAQWLYAAGLTTQAGQLLTTALTINKELPEALELSKKWGFGSGGPAHITFAYGVGPAQPLFLESMKDQGTDIMLQRNHVFFIVPIAHSVTDSRFNPAKGSLKVTGDDGKPCPIRGIVLLETADTSGEANADPSKPPQIKWPGESAPFYERMQLQQKTDKTGYELACYNTTPPIARPQPRAPGTPPPRNTPAPRAAQPGTAAPGGKELKPPTGYVAFVTEIPQAAQSLTIEYRGIEPLKVDIPFIRALGMSKDTPAADRGAMLDLLLKAVTSSDEAIATAAVWKLSALKGAGPAQSGQSGENFVLAGANDKIDKALISALGQPQGSARQAAFGALFKKGETTPENVLRQIHDYADPKVPMGLLDVIQAELARSAADVVQPSAIQTAAPGQAAAQPGDELPASGAGSSIFAALGACLAHKDPAVARRTIEILLADGTKESADVLARAAGPAREVAITQIGKSSPAFKGYLLRGMIAKLDGPTATRLIESLGSVTLKITKEDDPIFTAMTSSTSPQALQQIIQMLTRADLTRVSHSLKLRDALNLLTNSQMNEKGSRAALLSLAMSQIKGLPYEAPLVRDRPLAGVERPGTAFEDTLGLLATKSPDPAIARQAAICLVSSGRIVPLESRFIETDPKRRKEIIKWLMSDKSLSSSEGLHGEALLAFLAGRVSDPDPGTGHDAVIGLTNIKIDPKRKWFFNHAIHQRLNPRILIDHTMSTDEVLSLGARQVFYGFTQMPTNDRTEFEAATVHEVREQKLIAIEDKRMAAPSGPHAVLLYVDVKPMELSAGANQAALEPPATSTSSPRVLHLNVPVPGGEVLMTPSGNSVRVVYEGNDISAGFVPSPGGSLPSVLKVNVGTIMRSVLNSPGVSKYLPSDQLDLVMINDIKEGEMRYETGAEWSGEFQYGDSPTGSVGKDYKFMGAKIYFVQIPAK